MSSARRSVRSGGRSKSPDGLTGEQPGLRRLVQKRLLDDVFEKSSQKYPGWKVLIVDEHSMKVISAAVGMYDIMERKVTIVEALEKKRAPFPDMGAMYLLDPNHASSVSTMIQDFSGAKVLYGNAVFLYFLGRLPDALLNQIKTCKPLLKRLKCLVEVNIDFLAKEERAFTLDMRDSFASFYLRKGHQKYEQAIADKLVTVCATLNEYPHIRYKNSSNICTSLAATFHTKMDQFVNQNPTWWYHGGPKKQSSSGAPQRERGTLLLLDRSQDALSPLMHDFTYQSMVHDLLTMQGDCITYQCEKADNPNETEKKDVLLDERDKLWVELRGKHIAQVIETLSERIRDITNSSTGNALNKKSGGGGGNMSLSQMASALKALPEYREVMSKLSQHMHLSHECMDVFRAQNLLSLSELEQTLATGKNEDGNTPKTSDVMDQVEAAFARMKNPIDRLRLLLIATISQGGLRSDDRRLLMNAADLSRDHTKTLNSLEMLGISIFSTAEKNKLVSMMLGSRIASAASSDDESEYAASRYVPKLKFILEDWATNNLSLDEYPSVMPMPDMAPIASTGGIRGGKRGGGSATSSSATSSARSREAVASSARKSRGPSKNWSKSSAGGSSADGSATGGADGPTRFNGGRAIVFTVGGMSFSELRVAREVSARESREIVAGSTAFISPNDFLEDLAKLGKDE